MNRDKKESEMSKKTGNERVNKIICGLRRTESHWCEIIHKSTKYAHTKIIFGPIKRLICAVHKINGNDMISRTK